MSSQFLVSRKGPGSRDRALSQSGMLLLPARVPLTPVRSRVGTEEPIASSVGTEEFRCSSANGAPSPSPPSRGNQAWCTPDLPSSTSPAWKESQPRPPSPSRSQRAGHIGMMQAMRRSDPHLVRAVHEEARKSSRSARQRLEPQVAFTTPSPAPGTSTEPGSDDRCTLESPDDPRWHSSLLKTTAKVSPAPASCSDRAASAPPGRADDSARAKLRAVAALQRLFFEEISKGQDANAAAAMALRRLTEGPAGMASSTVISDVAAASMVEPVNAPVAGRVPIRPSPLIPRPAHRRPFVRVAVKT